jgi:hypothetical protein
LSRPYDSPPGRLYTHSVNAKASDQTMTIVARAIAKGLSLRSSIRIPSNGLDCLTLPNIAASPLEPPHRIQDRATYFPFICASTQFAFADESGTVGGAVGGATVGAAVGRPVGAVVGGTAIGNSITNHRHYRHHYYVYNPYHRHYYYGR